MTFPATILHILTVALIRNQIARDIHDTFDTVLSMMEEVVDGLPTLDIYIHLFGSSEHELLKVPLVNTFTELVLFGTRAIELFDRSAIRKYSAIWPQCRILII